MKGGERRGKGEKWAEVGIMFSSNVRLGGGSNWTGDEIAKCAAAGQKKGERRKRKKGKLA